MNYEVSKIDSITVCYSVFVCQGTHRQVHKSFEDLGPAEQYYQQCLKSGHYEYSSLEKVVRVTAIPSDIVITQKIDVGAKKEFPK